MLQVELSHPDFGFTVKDRHGNSLEIDIPVDQGGRGKGLRPMHTVLAALCGCSGVDVVKILRKQRQVIESFHISVDGEREEKVEPSLWRKVHLHYDLTGVLETSKVARAVELSIQKYCSVAEMLRQAGAEISWSLRVNGKLVN